MQPVRPVVGVAVTAALMGTAALAAFSSMFAGMANFDDPSAPAGPPSEAYLVAAILLFLASGAIGSAVGGQAWIRWVPFAVAAVVGIVATLGVAIANAT